MARVQTMVAKIQLTHDEELRCHGFDVKEAVTCAHCEAFALRHMGCLSRNCALDQPYAAPAYASSPKQKGRVESLQLFPRRQPLGRAADTRHAESAGGASGHLAGGHSPDTIPAGMGNSISGPKCHMVAVRGMDVQMRGSECESPGLDDERVAAFKALITCKEVDPGMFTVRSGP